MIDALVVEPSPSGSFHLYAMTNEVVPEPGSFTLVAIGALVMFATRQRQL